MRHFATAKENRMEIPQTNQGTLLLQDARLTEQGKQNVTSLIRRPLPRDDIF